MLEYSNRPRLKQAFYISGSIKSVLLCGLIDQVSGRGSSTAHTSNGPEGEGGPVHIIPLRPPGECGAKRGDAENIGNGWLE